MVNKRGGLIHAPCEVGCKKRRRFKNLNRAKPFWDRNAVLIRHEFAQVCNAVATVIDECWAARRQVASGLRTKRRPSQLREGCEPRFFRPSERQRIGAYALIVEVKS